MNTINKIIYIPHYIYMIMVQKINIHDLFGTKMQIEIVQYYRRQPDAIVDISKLAREFDSAHITIKKSTDKLVNAGFLREFRLGRSKVLMLNRSDKLYEQTFNFLDVIENKTDISTLY